MNANPYTQYHDNYHDYSDNYLDVYSDNYLDDYSDNYHDDYCYDYREACTLNDCSHLSQYQTDISSKVPENRNNMDDTDRKHLICH